MALTIFGIVNLRVASKLYGQPQIGGYTTEIILINTTSSDTALQANFYDDSGQQ